MLSVSLNYQCQVSVPLNCQVSIPFMLVPIIFCLPAPVISTNHRACFEVQVMVHWQQACRQQRGSDCNKSPEDAEFLKCFKVCHLFSVIIMQIQTPKTYTSAWCRSYLPYSGQPGTNLPISTNCIIYFLSKSSFCLYFTVLFMIWLYLAFGIIRGFNPTSVW